MPYIAIKDLKKSREVLDKLEQERELILTRDGKPCAILVGISESSAESDMASIRRALFSSSVSNARRRHQAAPLGAGEIDSMIEEARNLRDDT